MPEQQEYVGIFRRAGLSLLTLLNDILDLSKVEAGYVELERIEFDLHEVVDKTAEMMALRAHVDFSSLFLTLSGQPQPSLAAAKAAGAPTINYGVFLQTIVDFVIIAFVIFLIVKQVNRLKSSDAPAAPPTTRGCPYCLSDIPVKATRCAHCTSDVKAA